MSKWDYQKKLIKQCSKILIKKELVYLAGQMRVGKTRISLNTAENYFKHHKIMIGSVLFFTKPKAIPGIKVDYLKSKHLTFKLSVTNYEQAHNVDPNEFDLIIVDEGHNLGAFPRPSLRTKKVKKVVGDKPLILMSGTPSPESYSQLFHQYWLSSNTPFHNYSNFYRWAVVHVDVTDKHVGSHTIKDYSDANWKMIKKTIKPYVVSVTQKEAGIKHKIQDKTFRATLSNETNVIMRELLTERMYESPQGWLVLGDTPVKLRSKIHQLCSGTVKDEDGEYHVLDYSKVKSIYKKFKGKKVGIFYIYKAEAVALETLSLLGKKKHRLYKYDTDDEFNEGKLPGYYMSQIQSGSEGISLREADVIIFYNIPYSARMFIQARARQQDKRRKKKSKVLWLFSDSIYSIEEKIHDTVVGKMDYTTSHFRQDYL